MRILTYIADKSFCGKKASALLSRCGFSAEIIKLLKRGGLLINGSSAPTVQLLREKDEVTVMLPDEMPGAKPVFIDEVSIVYFDEDVAVIDKPPFLPVHQSIGHYTDTLANHFAYCFPSCAFRAVTRLDKNTSGLCVIALNKLSAAIMCRKRPIKLYYAAVEGKAEAEATIDAPIAREGEGIIKRRVSPDGQRAVTHYKTVMEFCGGSLLEISLDTGRTHQIRVHMSHIGHPLFGDELYGGSCDRINRQALHCGYVRFVHPITGAETEFKSELPKDMAGLMRADSFPNN